MDLILALGIMLNWILYIGLALSVVLLIISLFLASLGRYSSKLFFSALAGILIGSTATLIQNALVGGISIGDPYTLIAILIVSGFIIASVLSFGLGNPENGARYFFAAAIAAGFFAAIPAIQAVFGAQVTMPTGACTLEVKSLTQNETLFGIVNLDFALTYGNGTYDLVVYWGDGKTDRTTISPGQTVSLTHQYSEEGGYGVVAIARSKDGGLCTATLGINVKNKPFPWFSSMFDPTGATNIVSQLVSIPYQLFYTSPEFDTKNNSDDMKAYQMVAAIAISFIGIFIVLRFASGFFSKDPSESLIDSLKDAVIVIVAILIAPFIYQIFVSMCNMVSLSAAYYADLENPAGLATVLGLIAASVALGVFSSFFGTLGGTLAMVLMLASVMATIRFALIKAIIYCVPLLAVAFLFPVARGVTRFFINLLVGLILAGPIAAFVLVGMGTIPGIGGIAKFLAPVIAMIAFPFLFTIVGGSGPITAATPLTRIGAGLMGSLAPKGGNSFSATPAQGQRPGPGGGSGGVTYSNVNHRVAPQAGSPSGTSNISNSSNVSGNANLGGTVAPQPGNPSGTSNISNNSGLESFSALDRFTQRPDFREFVSNRTPNNQPPAQGMQTSEGTQQTQVLETNQIQSETPGDQSSTEIPPAPENTPSDQSPAEGSDRPAERSSRIKTVGKKLVEARRSIMSRYNALADNPSISKLSSDFSRGASLVIGGRLSGNNELMRANIEAAKAKKEFYEARTRLLESIERDLHLNEDDRENERDNSERRQ